MYTIFFFDIQNNLCTQHVLYMFWAWNFHVPHNSMNNLSSYCGCKNKCFGKYLSICKQCRWRIFWFWCSRYSIFLPQLGWTNINFQIDLTLWRCIYRDGSSVCVAGANSCSIRAIVADPVEHMGTVGTLAHLILVLRFITSNQIRLFEVNVIKSCRGLFLWFRIGDLGWFLG